MKVVRSFVLFFISLVVVSSCFEPPNFSDRPKIRIQDIEFINGPPLDFDTIKLTLFFQDGDGNLGLRNEETAYPFQPYNYFVDNDGDLFNLYTLFYETKSFDPAMKITRKMSKVNRVPDLADFAPPTDCLNYKYDSIGIPVELSYLTDETYDVKPYTYDGEPYILITDTLYMEPNKNHFNIDVSIWIQCDCEGAINSSPCCMDRNNDNLPDNEYEFQFAREPWPVCGEGFNGRFPYVARKNESATEGTIAYSIKSIGFESDIGLSTRIKIKARIRDRALNESNEVISATFSLSEKTRR